jgi:hypothetical protein
MTWRWRKKVKCVYCIECGGQVEPFWATPAATERTYSSGSIEYRSAIHRILA